jgi:hypothetical protein
VRLSRASAHTMRTYVQSAWPHEVETRIFQDRRSAKACAPQLKSADRTMVVQWQRVSPRPGHRCDAMCSEICGGLLSVPTTLRRLISEVSCITGLTNTRDLRGVADRTLSVPRSPFSQC